MIDDINPARGPGRSRRRRRLAVLVDDDALEQLRARLLRARESPEAIALLDAAREHLDVALAATGEPARARATLWRALDAAYDAVDRYLELLARAAEVPVRCGPGCAACCTEAPPVHAIEGLRLARALLERADGGERVQRAVDQARAFQAMLLARAQAAGADHVMTRTRLYRETQEQWRRSGRSCPVLGADGRCSAYAARPLACRVYVSVDDPAKCDPRHPGFATLRRPALWASERERSVERQLARLGSALSLPAAPNLQWAVAQLHDHPLTSS
ncbi:MAG: YkgJ family cysteine cluster protein [Myxococcales bacterium]|nr:YkgJ family cysteine cluster protein [Myxococcales bacterium]MCB9750006.1 YkgJ family cysteine cluster protein [Myxococcales bacterium]